MLKPFTTERLADPGRSELVRISDTPAVSQWMAFMEGGFPLRAMGVIDHPDGTLEVGYWFRVPLDRARPLF